MDKLGPIGRTVEDCALVFNAIYGPDGVDQSLYDDLKATQVRETWLDGKTVWVSDAVR